jgi:hypothetical protein
VHPDRASSAGLRPAGGLSPRNSSEPGWPVIEPRGLALVLSRRFCTPLHRALYWCPTPRGLDPAVKSMSTSCPADAFPASSPIQSVTPSQARDSPAFKHFGNVTTCSVVTDEKGENSSVSAGCDAVTYRMGPIRNGVSAEERAPGIDGACLQTRVSSPAIMTEICRRAVPADDPHPGPAAP